MMKRTIIALGVSVATLLVGCGGGGEKAVFDLTPPVIGTPSVTREAGTNRVLVQVQAYDAGSGIASVRVLAVGTDPTPEQVAMRPVPGMPEQYQAVLLASTVRLTVKAVDRNGNEVTSPEIRVPPPGPPF